jgi:hypothetical protein
MSNQGGVADQAHVPPGDDDLRLPRRYGS